MPDNLLAPGEVTLLVTRRHLITLIIPLLLILIAGLLFLAQTCPIAVAVQLDHRCHLIVAATVAGMTLPFALDWLTTRFVLTNQRVLLIQQPTWLLVRSVDLRAVEAVSVRRGILGELFGFGDVLIDSSATQGGRLALDFAPNPAAALTLVAAARARRRSHSPRPANTG
jgi:hypothetical protein